MKKTFLIALAALLFSACTPKEEVVEPAPEAEILDVRMNGKAISFSSVPFGVGVNDFEYVFRFTENLDINRLDKEQIRCNGAGFEDFDWTVDGNELHVKSNTQLPYFKKISFTFYSGENLGVKLDRKEQFSFITEYDPKDKFDRIPIEELLEKVQKTTFKYFWDYAHPDCGLARERLGSGNTVTTGGSGFGIMSIPVAVERGWISREEGAERALLVATFLQDKSQRFHGAWPHWLDGSTGKIVPFGTKDNGADLVETAFLVQGLLTLKEYFNADNDVEKEIRTRIQTLWEEVEWTWFQRDGEDALSWHWSETYGWDMNMRIQGWNEGLIVYVLAAASPTHSIDKSVYDNGWAGNGSMKFRKDVPMFFAHYSFLGLDPRNLEDAYGNYWDENVSHAEYNHNYCANSKKEYGYSASCWGLTACDYYKGYTASSPSNDTGTIAPTAALADFPYTPEESLAALEYFYYVLGDRLWGEYGFKDSFALKECWFATSYIAIDQGPIIAMIENYRTGLLWDTFMRNEDVRKGLDKLGFKY